MLSRHTDRDWERLARLNACWAVLTTHGTADAPAEDAAKLEEFLDSGRQYVARMWDVIERHFVPGFRPARALDFGCGVGRIVLPLADRSGSVVGVDVAESMLAKARDLCADRNVTNAIFVTGDDTLSQVRGKFDLVHTYIVLQHIPTSRGMQLLRRLVDLIDEGGLGVLHVLYYNPDMATPVRRLLKSAWRSLKRPFLRMPQMKMNSYSLSDVFRVIQDAGARQMHVLATDHDAGCLGTVIYFRKDANAPYLA